MVCGKFCFRMKTFLRQVRGTWTAAPQKRFILQPQLTSQSDFEPVVELHEISHEYEACRSELRTRLSSGLEDAVGTHLGDGRERSAQKIMDIVDGFMSDVLRKTQRQTSAGSSYPRPRRGGGGPPDGALEASPRLLRGFPEHLSAANIPRTPSTLSASTTSWPRNLLPQHPPTPARSNDSGSPAVPTRQFYNPGVSRLTSPTSNRSSPRRSMLGDPNGAQAQARSYQPLLDHALNMGSLATSFNDRTPERVGSRQSSTFGSATFPIPERAVTHHHDAVSQATHLHNFPQSSGFDAHQLPANVTGFQGHNNHLNLDFNLPGLAPASPSPWSGLALRSDASGSQQSPAPPRMSETQLDEYFLGTAQRSAELERGPVQDSSLNEVVMGGRHQPWPRPTDQERGYVQPRHGAQRESPVFEYCTDSDGRVRHHSDCAFADSPTLSTLCFLPLS